jgi:predicted lysophospholipase L1 biosynthesis ABC-type transport system permease subunit
MLAAVALAALLMPVAAFVAAAARFGGEARDRRLAALRLVGADRAATVRVAAGETALGAVGGVLVGGLLFLAARGLARHVTVYDISVFPGDVRPAAALAALVVLGVPLTAIAATTIALRPVVLDPLGVVRRAGRRRRRLAWRLVPVLLGAVLLAGLGAGDEARVAAAVVLLLAGVATLLPWLVEAVVRRLGGGGLAWQLAVRRLQLDGGASARAVSGIAVAVAGAIALQTVFSGVEAQNTHGTGADPRRAQVMLDLPDRTLGEAAARFARVPGVVAAFGVTGYDDGPVPLTVGSCTALRQFAGVRGCRPGDAFAAEGPARGWRAQTVTVGPDPAGGTPTGILATPAAAARHPGFGAPRAEIFVRVAPGDDPLERVRNAAAALDPTAGVYLLAVTQQSHQFAALRRAILAGAAATVLLVGASLLVALLEQVRDRRRLLAVLAAFGTRRTTLGRSVLWQAAVPVVLGLGLAVAAGTALGTVLLGVIHTPRAVDWGAVAALAGVGAAVVLGVTVLSLPPLWRLMRPDGLRTE